MQPKKQDITRAHMLKYEDVIFYDWWFHLREIDTYEATGKNKCVYGLNEWHHCKKIDKN